MVARQIIHITQACSKY